MSRMRARAKEMLPASLLGVGRKAVAYFCRLRTWRAIMAELRGASPADDAVLRRSRRRASLSALRHLDEWQDPRLIKDAIIEAPGIGRFEVRAFTDDLYQLLPSQEAAVLREIRARLKPGSIFVDAGANIGFFTVLASRLVGPTGKVFSIEMMPETADRLRRHIVANGLTNVTVFQCALSDRGGDAITAFLPQSRHGQASIARRAEGEGRDVSVMSRTLDEILTGSGPIDLVKMDIEGAEALALKGAGDVLSRTRAIIFEQLEDTASAESLLLEAGFDIQVLDPRNRVAERL